MRKAPSAHQPAAAKPQGTRRRGPSDSAVRLRVAVALEALEEAQRRIEVKLARLLAAVEKAPERRRKT